jgi:hypothetical protein
MKRDAWKRLAATEARARAAKVDRDPEASLAHVMRILVAARLGGWKESEALASAYARALALEPRDLITALQSLNLTDLRARHATAVHRLFGEAGVDLNNASAEHLAEAIGEMVADLPSRLRSFLIDHAAGAICRT